MNSDFDYDLEPEERPRKARPAGKRKQKKPAGEQGYESNVHVQRQNKPADKQSYESNVHVQLWLQDQALNAIGVKAPFNPTLLAGQRDRDWILSSLARFYEQDLITDVIHVAQSGK